MYNKNICTFLGMDNNYEESKIVIFGAPFDGTTSYRPGTRFASSEMRIQSEGIETYSPYLDKDLDDELIFDAGDLEFPFGNTKKVLDEIYSFVQNMVSDNKLPLMIGGEHLVSYPAIKCLSEKYDNLHIIHFDAHTDLREDYLGEKMSHATVIRRAWEHVGDNKIYQFGIRSGTKEEFEWSKSHTFLNKFNVSKLNQAIEEIKDAPVYITIDLDVLDPSVFPGTGTPEPGGITFNELLDSIIKLKNLNIVGADIVELSPHYDQSGGSTILACKVLRELLLTIS